MSDAFDKNFREKLSEEDFPFDPDAWKKMEKKLDALNEPADRKRPFWWWMAPLLLLLLGTSAYIWWRNTTPSTNAPDEAAVATQVTAPASTDTVATTSGNKTTLGKGTIDNPVVPGESTSSEKVAEAQSGVETTDNKNTTVEKLSIPPKPVTASNNNAAGNKTIIPPSAIKDNKQPAPVTPLITKEEKAPANVIMTSPATDRNNNIIQLLATHYAKEKPVSSKLNGNGYIALKESVDKTTEKKQQVPQRKGFSLSLMVGPVLNVAPSLQYGRIGVDAGLLVNYHVNNHWSFTTGAVYSIKPYGGTRSDYGVIKKWAPPASYVKNVDANCDVLDIPLNINYTLVNSPKYSLGLTAGISSYLMLKEKYQYKYEYYQKDWSVINENRHYFSVLNLAFTYQFPLSGHMSLGIQPYAKIPLQAVGYGEVRLYSSGVAFQLNFNQIKRK